MFNFVFALNHFVDTNKVLNMDERLMLARHCGGTTPVDSIEEALDELITILVALRGNL